MQARRAARELALMLFVQIDKNNIKECTNKKFEDILLKSVRILVQNALSDLKIGLTSVYELKEKITDLENDDPRNLQRPLDAANLPVKVPLSSELNEDLSKVIEASEKICLALEIVEIAALEQKQDVKDYVFKVAQNFEQNYQFIDDQIQKFAKGWDINRLVKIDKDILRIAITELLFVKDAPIKVVIDEAVELAKKYSTDDSSAFINGILGSIIEQNC